jgi:hypothetical protein
MAEITIVPGSIQLIKMTDAEYFSAKYKDYISNSKLGTINPDEGGSPEKYEAGTKSAYSESFELGSAIHAMVLQPDFYHIAEINKPTGKLGLWAEAVYKLRQEGLTIKQASVMASLDADYYANKFSDTRFKTALKGSLSFYLQRMKFVHKVDKQTLFLSAPMQFKYEQCMLGVAENKQMMETLYPSGLLVPAEFYNEYAILCELDFSDETTGEVTRLKLKAKLDNFTIDHETSSITLNDLKSSGKPASYFMGNNVKVTMESGTSSIEWYDGSFQKYHYHRQIGVYLWLLKNAVKEIYGLEYKLKANILVIETIPEFKSKVYSINGKQIQEGLAEFKNLLTLVVEWMQTK